MQRLSARGVPHADRLALVGHAHGGKLARRHAGVGQRLAGHLAGDLPDLGGVVLHPAGTGEVLGDLAIAAADRLGLLVEYQARRAGRALVDRENHACAGLDTAVARLPSRRLRPRDVEQLARPV